MNDDDSNQGRGPSPRTWRIIDALILAIGMGCLWWVLERSIS